MSFVMVRNRNFRSIALAFTGICRIDLVLDKSVFSAKMGLSLIGLAVLQDLPANARYLPDNGHINIDRPEELNI
jgi:hypothetical protein